MTLFGSNLSRVTLQSVGVPKEIKIHESRVALTPEGAKALTRAGVSVYIESGAGADIHLTDEMYIQAGATICNAKTAWKQNIVLKVKEPQASEYGYFRSDLTLFTYLHLAAYPQVARALCNAGTTGIAYETVSVNGALPLLAPMSEIAGKLSAQIAARFLEKPQGGRGILLSGATGVESAKVMVLGAGHVGLNAALIASGMGAQVELFDIDTKKLQTLEKKYPKRFTIVASTPDSIAKNIVAADAVIGGVLVPGKRAPIVVTEEMVKTMKPGSVIVDTAIDQGGCIETSHETSHADPTFMVHEVLHYAVGNMPGAVPYTSTYALTNVTIDFVLSLATLDLDIALETVDGLREGLNTRGGEIVNEDVRIAVDGI